MAEAQTNFMMQVMLDTERVVAQAKDTYDEVTKVFATPVSVNLVGSAKMDEINKEIAKVSGQLEKLQKDLKESTNHLEGLQKQGVKAAGMLEGRFKSAGDRIAKAFKFGGVEGAQKSIARLTRQAEGGKDLKGRRELRKKVGDRAGHLEKKMRDANNKLSTSKVAELKIPLKVLPPNVKALRKHAHAAKKKLRKFVQEGREAEERGVRFSTEDGEAYRKEYEKLARKDLDADKQVKSALSEARGQRDIQVAAQGMPRYDPDRDEGTLAFYKDLKNTVDRPGAGEAYSSRDPEENLQKKIKDTNRPFTDSVSNRVHGLYGDSGIDGTLSDIKKGIKTADEQQDGMMKKTLTQLETALRRVADVVDDPEQLDAGVEKEINALFRRIARLEATRQLHKESGAAEDVSRQRLKADSFAGVSRSMQQGKDAAGGLIRDADSKTVRLDELRVGQAEAAGPASSPEAMLQALRSVAATGGGTATGGASLGVDVDELAKELSARKFRILIDGDNVYDQVRDAIKGKKIPIRLDIESGNSEELNKTIKKSAKAATKASKGVSTKLGGAADGWQKHLKKMRGETAEAVRKINISLNKIQASKADLGVTAKNWDLVLQAMRKETKATAHKVNVSLRKIRGSKVAFGVTSKNWRAVLKEMRTSTLATTGKINATLATIAKDKKGSTLKIGVDKKLFADSVLASVRAVNAMKLDVRLGSNLEPLVKDIKKAAAKGQAAGRTGTKTATKTAAKSQEQEAHRTERARRTEERKKADRKRQTINNEIQRSASKNSSTKGYGTTVNNSKELQNPADIEAEYRRQTAEFDTSMRSFEGLDMVGPTSTGERDVWKEQEQAYKKYVGTVQKFETANMDLMRTRTEEERVAGRNRVDKAKKAVELARDEMHFRVLSERTDRVQIDTFAAQPGGLKKSGKQVVEARDAYSAMNRMFEREFEGTLSTINAGKDDLRNKLQGEGRLQEASLVKNDKLKDFTGRLFGGDKETVNQYLKMKGLSNTTLRNEKKRGAATRRLIEPLRDNYAMYHKITGEIKEQVDQMQKLNRFDKMRKAHRGAKQQAGGQFGNAARAIGYQVGGFGAGMYVAWQLQEALRTYVEFEDEMKQIQGVLASKSEYDAQNIAQGVAEVSARYGADLLETAQAAKILAQTGLDANEVLSELNFTMMAMRGLDMTIDQMQELQVAVRAVAGDAVRLTTTLEVLDKISAVEAQRAVTAQNLADAIKLVGPMMEQYTGNMANMGDAISQTIGMSTVMIEHLRISGAQAGNSLKFIFARILRPNVMKSLQDDFDLRLGDATGRDLLALPDLLGEIAHKYKELKDTGDGGMAKSLAVTLAGGRQVNRLVALLENYDESVEIAKNATDAFGSAQERTEIQMESMKSKLGQLRAGFNLFTKSLIDSSGASFLAKDAIGGLTAVLGGVGGSGGGVPALIGLTMGVGVAVSGARGGARMLSDMGEASAMNMPYREFKKQERDLARRKMGALGKGGKAGGVTRSVGKLGKLLTPTGAMITGALVLVGVIGAIRKSMADSESDIEKYGIQLKTLEELKIWDSGQMQDFRKLAQDKGLGTARNAFDKVSTAVVKPGAGSEIAGLLQQYGVKSFSELHNYMKEHTGDWEGLRRKMSDALIKDLGVYGEGLSTIKNKQEQVAASIKLIGMASWTANFNIARSIDALRQSSQLMMDETREGMDLLDGSGREGWWEKTYGGIKDALTGTVLLDTTIPELQVKIIGEASKAARVDGYVGGAPRRQTPEELSRYILGDVLKGFPDAVGNALRQSGFGGVLAEVLKTSESRWNGKESSVTIAAALWETAQTIQRNDENGVKRFTPRDGWVTTRESLVRGFANSFTNLLEGKVPTGNPAYMQSTKENLDAFEQFITGLMEEGRAQAITTAIENGQTELAEQLKAAGLLGEDARGAKKARLVVDGTAAALSKFKDTLLEAMIAFRQQIVAIETEQELSERFGFGYNEAEEKLSASKSAYINYKKLLPGMEGETLKLNSELKNLREATTVGAIIQGNRDLEEGVESEAADRALSLKENERELHDRVMAQRRALDKIREEGIALKDMIDLNTPEGRSFLAFLEKVGGAMLDVNAIHRTYGDLQLRNIEINKKFVDEQKDQVHYSGMQKSLLEKKQEVTKLLLENETSLTRRVEARERMENDMLNVQIMQTMQKQGMGKEEQRRELESLLFNHALNQLFERRVELARAQGEYENQIRDNLTSMLSGVQGVMANFSIWENMNGEKAKATLLSILNPIGQTFADRTAENMMASLTEHLMGVKGVGDILGTPETRLKDKIAEAHTLGTDYFMNQLLTSAALAGDIMGNHAAYQLLKGQGVTEDQLASLGLTMTGGKSNGLSPEGLDLRQKVPGGKSNDLPPKEAFNLGKLWDAVGPQVVSLAGTHIGTAVGGGSEAASMGASLGTMLGTALGGPVGGFAGSIVGGLGGKLFDDVFGDGDKESPTFKALDAIERAQRETISAIEQQTDAIINPQNTLLNAPSTFSLPNFNPGNSVGTVFNNQRVTLNLSVDGGDVEEVKRVATEAVEDALLSGIRSGSRK